jgi:hypothetical protein
MEGFLVSVLVGVKFISDQTWEYGQGRLMQAELTINGSALPSTSFFCNGTQNIGI